MSTIHTLENRPSMTAARGLHAPITTFVGPPLAKPAMDDIRRDIGRRWVDACMAHEARTGRRPRHVQVAHSSTRVLAVRVVG